MDRHDYECGGAYQTAHRGEQLPHSKLTEKQVSEIRRLHKAKQDQIASLNREFSAAAFANKYGVHKSTIEKILSYETWTHLKG